MLLNFLSNFHYFVLQNIIVNLLILLNGLSRIGYKANHIYIFILEWALFYQLSSSLAPTPISCSHQRKFDPWKI